jgi:type III pantothenate kinase
MILEIDIGNTWTKWRLVNADAGMSSTVTKGKTRSVEFPLNDVLSLRNIRRVRLVSVSSREMTMGITQSLSSVFGVVVEIAESMHNQAGLTNSYKDPSCMGADRWLAMLAAFNHQAVRTAKRGCLVVSCGTAVTLDSIHSDGMHEGGYILPGLFMMREALLSQTRRIQFALGKFDVSRALGNSTAEAVEHGAVHSVLSAVEQSCDGRVKRLGSCDLFITGGDALALIEQFRFVSPSVTCHYVEDLVLDGLQYSLP